MEKECLVCKKKFSKDKNLSLKNWNKRSKYCSKQCFYQARKGVRVSPNSEFKKGLIPYNKGKYDLNTKYGIHHWVKDTLGKPEECEQCGSKLYVEWSNKSQKYEANKNDWIRLCRKCHMEYDRSFGLRDKFYHGHWKGGKPKCVDCGKQLSSYLSKRCRMCNGKIQSVLKKGRHFSPATEFKAAGFA